MKCVLLWSALGALAGTMTIALDSPLAAGQSQSRHFVPTSTYVKRSIQGWTVRVNRKLLADKSDVGKKALALLDQKLAEIGRTVPPGACARLRKVPIWLGVDDGHAPCSEYHPNRDWLKANGYNSDKARCVEIGNASKFLAWSAGQPSMVLHELAHAYHHQVLGYNHAGLKEAYRRAVAGGQYEHVPRNNGRTDRAYALNDVQEYFAEGSEAYFGRNDFYPFDRQELKKHDPELYRLMGELWGL